MKVLLLCGYRISDHEQIPLGLERTSSGECLIDRRIDELQAQGFEVICVLAGHSSEQVLRESRRLADVELVFDTNAEQASLASNLQAGLAATAGEGCFALPLEVPCPPPEAWASLRERWRREGFHTDISVFQLVAPLGAPWHFGFPLLISRKGNARIRASHGFVSLVDTRLKYAGTLAPTLNPL